ncbi:DUF2306 domain-containing protein [Stenotrophomonas sp. 24(2023)]|uniref:DUF2306 domain-containing protein n=1 Tax=Stenotrophomonas sp. 24(2023) TaxID=3068324 RepID=UPI0027E17CC1|nr:DUF2306 domain-containing protein [Stenotrophomonas sp. 24(2023)]WMJ68262.1 DUF2306 domain-containing protein [Stenotrophomonas sp. 24(2023)]
MSVPAVAAPLSSAARAQRLLRRSAAAWLACAALGQVLFALYVAVFYGRATLAGQPQRWNAVMPHGYQPGATAFNAVLAVHLLLAAAIVIAGLMQLLPPLRRAAPALHRWVGRGYVLAAALLALGGLSMVWIRGGAAGDTAQHLGTSLNALLVLWFAAAAWWQAWQGRIGAHRPWALRLFLAVSGVWFFRIGLMLWVVINQGPAGFDPDRFTGPALTTLAFAQTLLPLALLELYLRAQRQGTVWRAWLGSGLLGLAALLTLAGSVAAAALMWWPPLAS